MTAVMHTERELGSGAIEAAKWLALACMVVDHVNAALFSRELGEWATVIGRVSFPLFAVVLGLNLGNGADRVKLMQRLAFFGCLAIPFHSLLFSHLGGWWPLNVLWTFAVAVGVLHAHHLGERVIAAGLFIAGGVLVEYWWPGLVLVLASYGVARRGLSLAYLVPALLPLCLLNGNLWALLAVPVLVFLAIWQPHVPRCGRFFWWFYPVHLAALVIVVCMARV